MQTCSHQEVVCLNPYELIRKYRCNSCSEIMMCSCEQDIGETFLPHQTSEASVLDTGERLSVTLGFQKNICPTCRGQKEAPYPTNAFGVNSKIKKFYWREISHESMRSFSKWALENEISDILMAAHGMNNDIYKEHQERALEKIKKLHAENPKYEMAEKTQDEVLKENNIEVLKFNAEHIKSEKRKGLKIKYKDKALTPEEFVSHHLQEKGYQIVELESRPFHALFGVFMWMLVQSIDDEKNKVVCFGTRKGYDPKKPNEKMIYSTLPEDFGKSGYGGRRKKEITEHLDSLPEDKEELLWTFDYWVDHSENLREYLWAHEEVDVQKARILTERLPTQVIKNILRYLVDSYWERHLGWPDLFAYNEDEFLFVEVKSSKDKLSVDQKNWIENNSSYLNLPFKLAKIHKENSQSKGL
ncbi:VRR-NUC domain-containing protein [Bacteriovoracaceae bacterium]|nr:VRR-NUC domain-containing protein [Bacteriovoracaceae bacterium]